MRQTTSGFALMLVLTMAFSAFALFTLSVIASELKAEFNISNFDLGVLGAVNSGVGGLFSLVAGPLSDRIGGRRAMGGVLLTASIGAAAAALAGSYWVLVGAMAISGIPQGWGNPATNRAIADNVAPERRGAVTGIKQAGIQLGVFATGFGIPAVTNAWGWRSGMWMLCVASLVTLAGLRFVGGGRPTLADRKKFQAARTPLPPYVYQVTIYAFLLGMVGVGQGRFLPLFSEDVVGLSNTMAGIVFGLSGLVAIPSRILWGLALDRGFLTRRALTFCGTGAAITAVLLLISNSGSAAPLWIATVVSGITLGSWNTAANVAMIRETGTAGAGRATGVLYLGFLSGITVGGPLAGWSIDATGGYVPVWGASVLASVLAVVVLVPTLVERNNRPTEPAAR